MSTVKPPHPVLSTPKTPGSTTQCPGRSLGHCLRCTASALRQKKKFNHLPQHLLALLPAKTIQHVQSTFMCCCRIMKPSFSVTYYQADQTEHCNVLYLLCWKTRLPSSKALTCRLLQPAWKLICNSRPFYRVNRRHSSGSMNCLETTAGNSQLLAALSGLGRIKHYGLRVFSGGVGGVGGGWLHINGQGEGLVANTESWGPREAP